MQSSGVASSTLAGEMDAEQTEREGVVLCQQQIFVVHSFHCCPENNNNTDDEDEVLEMLRTRVI